MAIVTTSIESSPQADGSRHVVERYIDDAGVEYMRSYFAAKDLDLDKHVAAYVPIFEQELADSRVRRKREVDTANAETKSLDYLRAQDDAVLKSSVKLTDDEISALKASESKVVAVEAKLGG